MEVNLNSISVTWIIIFISYVKKNFELECVANAFTTDYYELYKYKAVEIETIFSIVL